jgi:UDP-N-acetylglucosamine:LPS N-acetylglucosamine transferase
VAIPAYETQDKGDDSKQFSGSLMAKIKVLAVSSGGGHWVQLQRLKPAFRDFEMVYVSVDPSLQVDVPGERLLVVRDATRKSKWALVVCGMQILRIMISERPDVVITTGAAPGLLALAAGRWLTRARTVWVDSIANAEELSGAGRMAKRVADVWLTQWPHLAEGEGTPQYWGAVL